MVECRFCGAGEHAIEIKENNQKVNRKVFENNDFYVMVSIGAVVEGHLLIIPKKHYLNMGELPKNLMDDLVSLINSLKDFLHNQYCKAVIVFEHGTGCNAHTSAASVTHAHIHLTPVAESLLNDLKDFKCKVNPMDSYHELKKFADAGESYLLYQDIDEQLYSIKETGLPSQFFRKIISEKYDLGEWDWHKDYKQNNIIKTVKKIQYINIGENLDSMLKIV